MSDKTISITKTSTTTTITQNLMKHDKFGNYLVTKVKYGDGGKVEVAEPQTVYVLAMSAHGVTKSSPDFSTFTTCETRFTDFNSLMQKCPPTPRMGDVYRPHIHVDQNSVTFVRLFIKQIDQIRKTFPERDLSHLRIHIVVFLKKADFTKEQFEKYDEMIYSLQSTGFTNPGLIHFVADEITPECQLFLRSEITNWHYIVTNSVDYYPSILSIPYMVPSSDLPLEPIELGFPTPVTYLDSYGTKTTVSSYDKDTRFYITVPSHDFETSYLFKLPDNLEGWDLFPTCIHPYYYTSTTDMSEPQHFLLAYLLKVNSYNIDNMCHTPGKMKVNEFKMNLKQLETLRAAAVKGELESSLDSVIGLFNEVIIEPAEEDAKRETEEYVVLKEYCDQLVLSYDEEKMTHDQIKLYSSLFPTLFPKKLGGYGYNTKLSREISSVPNFRNNFGTSFGTKLGRF